MELPGAGAFRHAANISGKAGEASRIGLRERQDDEPSLTEVDGDPEVDAAVERLRARLQVERAVHRRKSAERIDRRPRDEREVGQ